MSVQWWHQGKRISFKDALDAHMRGKHPHGTVAARNDAPTIYGSIDWYGVIWVETMQRRMFRVPYFHTLNNILCGIDWERNHGWRRRNGVYQRPVRAMEIWEEKVEKEEKK